MRCKVSNSNCVQEKAAVQMIITFTHDKRGHMVSGKDVKTVPRKEKRTGFTERGSDK